MKKLFTLFLVFICYNVEAQTTQDTIDKPLYRAMMSDRTVNFYKTKRAYDLYFSNKAKVRGTGWKQFERWADNASKIINRDGSFPPIDKVEKVMAQYNRNNLTPRSNGGAWVSVGPDKEPGLGKWAGGNMSGAGTGRLNVLVIHPTNSDIMYAGAPQGGLWKTTNAGVSWTQVPGLASSIAINEVVLFPNDANRILVGTGDEKQNSSLGRGVYLSTNSGTSFSFVSIPLIAANTSYPNRSDANLSITKFLVNPLNENTVIMASKFGIYKSHNKGSNWFQVIIDTCFQDLAYAPNDTNIVYAVAGKNDLGAINNIGLVMKSTDGGSSFSISMNGISNINSRRNQIAVTAANPNIVYLLRANSKNMEGFYKSSDKGNSWTKILSHTQFNLMGYNIDGSDSLEGQGDYDLALYADNLDSNRLIVGGINLYESTNGGANWTGRTCWNGCNSLPVTHSDVHYITKNTNTNTFYICNDGGLYKTSNMTSFTPIYDGMVISQFYDIDVTQAVNGRLVGGLQDNSMVERKNGNWLTHLGGDGMVAEVSDFDPNLMIGSSQNGGLEFTNDGFASASHRIANGSGYGINEAGPWVTPFQMSPFNDNLFVSAFNTKVFYTKTLRALDPNNKDANLFKSLAISGEGTAVRFSNKDSNICFVGTKTGNIYRINNMANGSTPTITQLTSPNTGFAINDIETSHKNADTLWVVVDSMVYLSGNGGTSWTDITGNLPAIKKFSIIADKFSSFDRVYVGTESGVYINSASSINNTTWQAFSTSLPQFTHIRDLEIWYDTLCHSNSSLYAGTYGRGAWKSDLYRAEDVNFTINGSATPTVATNTNYTIAFATGLPIASAKWSVTPSAGVTFANNNADSTTGAMTFANPGVYTIKVKAVNNHGGFCTKTKTVTVGTPSNITVKVSSSSATNKICVGDSVTLTASGGVSYTISPTSNTTKLNDSTFKVKPSSTTLYTIVGTGSNGQTDKDSVKITASNVTPVTVNPASSVVVSGATVNIAASGGVSYKWSPSTYLTSTTNVATITSKPTANITYTVEGTDAQGCKSAAMATVNVSAAPLSVQVTSTTTTSVCKGSKLTLKGSGASSYTLAPMTNVVKINDSMFEVSPMMNTNYYLTGTTGSNSGSDSIAIQVNSLPIIAVNPPVSVGASGSSRTLSASGAVSYTWTPNVFVVSGANTASLTVAPTSTTLYTVEGTDAKGCRGSNTANVVVQSPPPTGLFAPNVKLIRSTSSDSICQGENVNFTVRRTILSGATTNITYSLTPMTNVTKVNDTTFEVLPSITTKYFLTGIDENNLVGVDSANITVLALPNVSVSPASAYVMLGNSATLTASGGGTYTWSPSNYVTSDTMSAALNFTPTDFINYEVEVEGTNGCSNYMEVPVGVYTLRTATASACKSYDWGGNTYTSSGIYSDTFEASTGIDSIVTLNLTIQNTPIVVATNTVSTATNPYNWRGKFYTATGIYKDTFSNPSGCDSVFTLNLTITTAGKLPAVLLTRTESACDSFVWRGKVYKLSGTYNDTVVNVTRDTIHQLTLSIGSINTSVSYANGVFTSNCISCTYQWYICHGSGFTAIQNATSRTLATTTSGDVRVEVKQGGCSGFSNCVNKMTVSIVANYGKEILAYPNPVQNVLYLSTEKPYSELNIVIMDISGKVIMSQSYKNTQDIKIATEAITIGNYILHVYNGNELKSTLKLTKE